MGKSIINKHIDNSSKIKRGLFHDDLTKAKGEIVINNDAENPSIYIVNNDNEVVKISGNDSGTGGVEYDDTRIWNQVNENTNNIRQLQENIYDDSEIRELINDNIKAVEELSEEIQENVYDDTNIRELINVNIENINNLKNDIDNIECEPYDDSEIRNLININTEAIEEIKNTETENVLKENITVAGLTGQFGAGNYSNNDIITAGTSFTEILMNLLCKELYPENVITKKASATISLKELTLELDYGGDEVEVGSLVSLISGETNGIHIESNDSGIFNMDYGYSFNNDNIKVSNDTSITKPCILTQETNIYSISATIDEGFDADNNNYIKNTPNSVSQQDNAQLLRTVLGCINEGENKITINGTGPIYSYSAETVDKVYYCSNLGKTSTDKYIDGVDTSYNTLNAPVKSKTRKIKGSYKYFLGYSDYQSVEDFENKPNEIRLLNVKSDFIIKDDITTIIGNNKIKSNGKSIVIACPKKYKLNTIDDSTGASLLGSFKSQGEINIQTGMIISTYNVYLLPIANGTELEFKNVTLIKG